jgi:hypothetical protein
MTEQNLQAIEYISRVKEAYRKEASSLSWEEKVESMERMMIMSQTAKASMRKMREGDELAKEARLEVKQLQSGCNTVGGDAFNRPK